MDEIMSPCVNVCEMGPHGYCKGCLRDEDEITDWSYLENEEKLEILERLKERKTQLEAEVFVYSDV